MNPKAGDRVDICTSRTRRAIAAGVAMLPLMLVGCGDSGTISGPRDLVITTATTGVDISTDGYLVVVEGVGSQPIDPSGTITFEAVPARPHLVEVTGIPQNCTLVGANPRTVTAGSDPSLAGRFEITCVANLGMVEVTVTSTGTEVPGTYTLLMGDSFSEEVDANGVSLVEAVRAGETSVHLDLPANCSLGGQGNPRPLVVPFADVVSTTFEVTCSPNQGSLRVVTSTGGGDFDPDGYTVVVDGTITEAVGVNDETTFDLLPAGSRSVELSDVASNCIVLGDNPRSVDVPFEDTGSTTFNVECDPNGDLEVTSETTGMNIPVGFTAVVGGASNQSLGPDETIVFTDVPAGEHTVELIDLPTHCEVVGGSNPRTVSVANGFGSTTFVLECWGWLVFDSNRTGSWDVFIMRHDGSGQQNLTSHSADDRQPVVSPDGTRIAFASTRGGTEHIYVMNRDGTGVVQMTHTGQVNKEPSWSPDGSKLVFSRRQSSQWDVWMMDADDGSNQVNLTNHPAFDARGEWSPDGTKLLFDSTRDGTRNVYVMDPDGTGVTQLTTDGGANATWSPDGTRITFTSLPPDAEVDIWIMNADGTNQTNLTKVPAAGDGESAWSPDGSTIAFASGRGGNFEIYFMDPDGTNPRRITFNASDDMWPSWSR